MNVRSPSPLRFLLPIFAGLLAACRPKEAPPLPPGTTRILCIGDSITQADREHLSWRYYLWVHMREAGWKVGMVGSLDRHRGGNPDWPPHAGEDFPSWHAARWGWRSSQIAEALPRWMEKVDADIALIHLGTNDVLGQRPTADIVADMKRVIDILRADQPRIVIFLAQILPATNRVPAYNAALAEAAAAWNLPDSPVHLVDLHTGFDLETQTYDGLHPNEAGERWMAERWFDALRSEIKPK
jgi:lysophospholipase L1-like esterase